MHDTENYLTKSMYMQFLQCPLKFKLAYIDKMPVTRTAAQIRGWNVHLFAENFYKSVKIAGNDLIMPSLPPEFLFTDFEELEMIKNFIEVQSDRWKALMHEDDGIKRFFPVFSEKKFYNHDLRLKGVVDFSFLLNDSAALFELKTSKNDTDTSSVFKELYFYKLLTDKQLESDYLGVLFIRSKKTIVEKINDEKLSTAKDEIARVQAQIAAKYFPPKKNEWCFNCDFKRICPIWK